MNAYGMHACMLYEDGMHGKQREEGLLPTMKTNSEI
jgi:hypothetical protein